jgi:uncharacterized protein (DUF58 family)
MTEAERGYLLDGERAGSRYVLGTPRRILRGRAGVHLGARTGSSLEFEEHREYEPGDDLRHIDWNIYARTDQLSIKLFHEEVSPHLDLVVDGSRSMALAESAKSRAALGLAALFATAAANAGFSHRFWRAADGCTALPGGTGRPALWQECGFDHVGSLGDAFARRPPAWRPRSVRVVLSDLFWLGDPLTLLAPAADQATALVIVQLLARADANPETLGNLKLQDVETGQLREIFVDDATLRRYRDALDRHRELWHLACRQVGGFFTTLIAEDVVESWRLDALVAAEVLRVE